MITEMKRQQTIRGECTLPKLTESVFGGSWGSNCMFVEVSRMPRASISSRLEHGSGISTRNEIPTSISVEKSLKKASNSSDKVDRSQITIEGVFSPNSKRSTSVGIGEVPDLGGFVHLAEL